MVLLCLGKEEMKIYKRSLQALFSQLLVAHSHVACPAHPDGELAHERLNNWDQVENLKGRKFFCLHFPFVSYKSSQGSCSSSLGKIPWCDSPENG